MKKLFYCALLCASMAHAEFFSGKFLLDKITSSEPTDQALAGGYILGVFDSHLGISHCSPPGFTAKNLFDVTKFSLEQNMKLLDTTPADIFITRILSIAYPCKKGTSI